MEADDLPGVCKREESRHPRLNKYPPPPPSRMNAMSYCSVPEVSFVFGFRLFACVCAGRDFGEEVDEAGAGVREPQRLPLKREGMPCSNMSYLSG